MASPTRKTISKRTIFKVVLILLTITMILIVAALIFGKRQTNISDDDVTEESGDATTSDSAAETLDEGEIVDISTSKYTYDMFSSDVSELCEKYPNVLKCEKLGLSYDGRDIMHLDLGNKEAAHHILIVGPVRGNEYAYSKLLMKMAENYASSYNAGEYEGTTYADIFNNVEIQMIPMPNPDGATIAQEGIDGIASEELKEAVRNCYEIDKFNLSHELSDDGEYSWVDHSEEGGYNVLLSDNPEMIEMYEYTKLWEGNAYGIDLMKNFEVNWDNIESRSNPSYKGYKGPGAMSDVETALLYTMAVDKEYDMIVIFGSKSTSSETSSLEDFVVNTLGTDCRTWSFPDDSESLAGDLPEIYNENIELIAGMAKECMD